MAQTKKKRRRKHTGTQAGTVERRASAGSRGRPQSKEESRTAARERRIERLNTPPTWRGAVIRAAIAAAIFAVVVVLLFGRPPAQGLALAGVMFLIYIPMSYFTDKFMYARRQRQRQRDRGS